MTTAIIGKESGKTVVRVTGSVKADTLARIKKLGANAKLESIRRELEQDGVEVTTEVLRDRTVFDDVVVTLVPNKSFSDIRKGYRAFLETVAAGYATTSAITERMQKIDPTWTRLNTQRYTYLAVKDGFCNKFKVAPTAIKKTHYTAKY